MCRMRRVCTACVAIARRAALSLCIVPHLPRNIARTMVPDSDGAHGKRCGNGEMAVGIGRDGRGKRQKREVAQRECREIVGFLQKCRLQLSR